jgi:hypothetical protein
MDRQQHPIAPRLRLLAAIGLGALSIIVSMLLIVTDALSGNASWAHHPGASAAPLLLIAGAITAASIARPPDRRHALIRLVAALAFAAWGVAQIAPGPAMAGALSDLAILLFVVDAGYAVIPDARGRLTRHHRHATPASPAPGPAGDNRLISPASGRLNPADAATPPCCATPNTCCTCVVREMCQQKADDHALQDQ